MLISIYKTKVPKIFHMILLLPDYNTQSFEYFTIYLKFLQQTKLDKDRK